MKPCYLGPIIKHMNGIGFKVTFKTLREANKYKEMNQWIIADDGYTIYNKKGAMEK